MKIKLFASTILVSILLVLGGCTSNKASSSQEADFSNAPITEASIRSALDGVSDSGYKIKLDKITSVIIIDQTGTDTPNDKAINISYTYDAWDDKDIVETAAGSSLELFRRLFKNKDVVRVVAQAKLPLVTDAGEGKTATLVRITLDRNTADKLDWSALKEDVLINHNALFEHVDAFTIDPSLAKYVSKRSN